MYVPADLRDIPINHLRIGAALASLLRKVGIAQIGDLRAKEIAALVQASPNPSAAVQLINFVRRVEHGQISLKSEPTLRKRTSGPIKISDHARQFSFERLPISVRLRHLMWQSGASDVAELEGLSWENLWVAPGGGPKTIAELEQLFQRIDARKFDHLRGLNPISAEDLPDFIEGLVHRLPRVWQEILVALFWPQKASVQRSRGSSIPRRSRRGPTPNSSRRTDL